MYQHIPSVYSGPESNPKKVSDFAPFFLKKQNKNYQLDLETPDKMPEDASFLKDIRQTLKSLDAEQRRAFIGEALKNLVDETFFNE